MPKQRRVSEYIEWTTLPYRTLRFWIIIVAALLLLASIWLINRYVLTTGGKTADSQPEMLEKRAAEFVYVDGDVKVKPADSIEWRQADEVKKLYPGDLIKTSVNSTCRVVFFDGTVYEVKPNSLISITESYENRATFRRTVNVELANGALDMSTTQKNNQQSKAKVETSNAVADIGEYTTASADYDSKLSDSKFKVSQGQASVQAKDSRKVMTLRANEEGQVKDGLLEKRVLPPAPLLLAPRTSEIFTSNNPQKVSIRLQWEVVNPSFKYRVSISSHPLFYQKLHESIVDSRGYLTISGLPYGIYYWRVVAMDKNVEGGASAAGMFGLRPMRVNQSKDIKFDLKEVIVIGNILEVIGKTEPDNFVTINGKMIILDRDGSFKHFTEPFSGSNTAKLEIVVKDYSGAVRTIQKLIKLD